MVDSKSRHSGWFKQLKANKKGKCLLTRLSFAKMNNAPSESITKKPTLNKTKSVKSVEKYFLITIANPAAKLI